MKSIRSRPTMPTIPAGEFKARCLELMDQVAESRRSFLITKRGKPVAKLVPVEDEVVDSFGFMKGTAFIHGDIVSPDPDAWGESDS